MKFLERLRETRRVRDPDDKRGLSDLRYFDWIECAGGYWVSAQACDGLWCEPQVTLDDLAAYTSFEVAVFHGSRNNGRRVRVGELIGAIPTHLTDAFTESDVSAPYMPAELVDELIDALTKAGPGLTEDRAMRSDEAAGAIECPVCRSAPGKKCVIAAFLRADERPLEGRYHVGRYRKANVAPPWVKGEIEEEVGEDSIA